jgi:hypothetical protein
VDAVIRWLTGYSQDGLEAALTALGHLPSAMLVGTGMAIGAGASWFGWKAGKTSKLPPRAVPA